MAWQVIAEGTDINELAVYEDLFLEGERGELRLYLAAPLLQDEINALEEQILARGVTLTAPVTQNGAFLSIRFQKAIAPLLILVGALASLGISGIIAWSLFREWFQETLTGLIVPLGLITIGGLALVLGLYYGAKGEK